MEIGQVATLITKHPYYEVGQLIPGKVYLYKVLSKEKVDEGWKYSLEIWCD